MHGLAMDWFSQSTLVESWEDDFLSKEELFVEDEKEVIENNWSFQIKPASKSQHPQCNFETSSINVKELQPACRISL